MQFYEEWFEDSSRAVRILERVLELDPTADWAFDSLKLLLDAAERWDDLFTLYDRAIDKAAAKKRAAFSRTPPRPRRTSPIGPSAPSSTWSSCTS